MRSGVHTSRHIRPVEHVVVRGLRVATVPEALTAAARWLGVVDIVALIDAAIFLELVSLEQLEVIARTRRPGGRRLRAALPLVDGRAQSLWESLLRLLHIVCGIEVEPQWELVDADGVLVAQADLWVVGTTALHEFDGDEHEKAPRRVGDRRRDRRVDRQGFVRRGYTGGDVIHRAVTILEDADRSLGRDHDPDSHTGMAPASPGLAVHPRREGRLPRADPRGAAPAAYRLKVAADRPCSARAACDPPPPRGMAYGRWRQTGHRSARKRAIVPPPSTVGHRLRPRPRGITLGVRPLRQAVPETSGVMR